MERECYFNLFKFILRNIYAEAQSKLELPEQNFGFGEVTLIGNNKEYTP